MPARFKLRAGSSVFWKLTSIVRRNGSFISLAPGANCRGEGFRIPGECRLELRCRCAHRAWTSIPRNQLLSDLAVRPIYHPPAERHRGPRPSCEGQPLSDQQGNRLGIAPASLLKPQRACAGVNAGPMHRGGSRPPHQCCLAFGDHESPPAGAARGMACGHVFRNQESSAPRLTGISKPSRRSAEAQQPVATCSRAQLLNGEGRSISAARPFKRTGPAVGCVLPGVERSGSRRNPSAVGQHLAWRQASGDHEPV